MKIYTEKWSKRLAVVLACLLLLLTLAGCGGKRAEAGDAGTMPTIDEGGDITLPSLEDGDDSPSEETNGQGQTEPNTGETQKPTEHSGNNGNGGNSGNGGGSVPTPGSIGG